MEPPEEDITALVPHEAFVCLFVPNTNSKKWFYAITLEPLYPGQKLVIVLDLENQRKAIKANMLTKSVDRLIDTSMQVGKAFAQSEYVKQFVNEGIRNRLLALYMIYRKDLCAPVRGTARAVPQYRWQYRTKVDFALRLLVMFPIYDRT